ncbi:HAD family hydrolase [Methylacidiphilum caldifontis]|uniref:Phosphoglycolate phosphatase n=1 Tax=Methylacidiphilum caldifontis TaxID=2795386 RepID=A0A4Y8PHE8_9BACT|nr:HAD family hydrolase [Methylacidiphilum caldifontis]QSR88536.1 HAD family hydrolase [Methylacidiphilum caldifontis]TFE72074.1 phosphoglycolate phosphatase [Methylacidiphilum caldifontis]
MKKIQTVILDWSGTLADDLPFVLRASNFVFSLYGKPKLSVEEFKETFFLPLKEFYKSYLPEVSFSEMDAHYHSLFRLLQVNIPLLPYALDFLNFCKQNRYTVILLSTIHRGHFFQQAKRLNIEKYFDRIYTEIEDKRVTIKQIIVKENIDPKKTIFFGDMVHDIEAAHAGGIFSAAVLTGYNSKNKLLAARPSFLFENLKEAIETLKALEEKLS